VHSRTCEGCVHVEHADIWLWRTIDRPRGRDDAIIISGLVDGLHDSVSKELERERIERVGLGVWMLRSIEISRGVGRRQMRHAIIVVVLQLKQLVQPMDVVLAQVDLSRIESIESVREIKRSDAAGA